MARFFLPADRFISETAELSAEESHHALHVMRMKEGDSFVVFNGEGSEADAKIVSVARSAASIEIGARRKSPLIPCHIVLAQAIPKGKNMELVIQKAVELGVSAIVPLLTERTIVRLEENEKLRKQDKWQALALEACKQCGQNFLPRVAPPISLLEFLKAEHPETGGLLVVGSLEEDAKKFSDAIAAAKNRHAEGINYAEILIGPEGDFSPEEMKSIRAAGRVPVTLGPIVLRTETAAIYCLSVLAHELLR